MLSYKQLFESIDTLTPELELERDTILDKINKVGGIDKLSDYERNFLDSFKTGNQQDVYNSEHNTFEDEQYKFELSKIEPYDGEEGGMRYRGIMYFKESDDQLEGSIVETEEGRVISSFRFNPDKTDYDIVDPEDFGDYESFLNYIADSLRDR